MKKKFNIIGTYVPNKHNMIDISNEIYKYTSGYPFLANRIRKVMDEGLDKDWTTANGFFYFPFSSVYI